MLELVHDDPLQLAPELNMRMRSILVSWLASLALEVGYSFETFWLAIELLDRMLLLREVKRSSFQLVGVSALCIAAKVEEVTTISVADYAYSTEASILEMEREILTALNFCTARQTPYVPKDSFLPATLYLVCHADRRDIQARINAMERQRKQGLLDGLLSDPAIHLDKVVSSLDA